MTTLVSRFSLGLYDLPPRETVAAGSIATAFRCALYDLPGDGGTAGSTLARAFRCGLTFPVRWPYSGGRVVSPSFALKAASEEEMTDLATAVVRTHRVG